MYKYNILIDDWHRPLSYLVRKVYLYDDFFVNIDNKCIANDIINLCRQRDNSFHCANIASCSELNDILKIRHGSESEFGFDGFESRFLCQMIRNLESSVPNPQSFT